MFAAGSAEELRLGARETIRHVRSLAGSLEDDRGSMLNALDAWCVAEELVTMARIASIGIGRG